jgi:hypothetical protein
MKVAAYVPDLMDRSRLDAAARAAGATVIHAPTPAALDRGADLVVVDLGRPGVLEVLGAHSAQRTVGFASHVDRDLLRAARRAGCQTVLTRSVFFGRLGSLLGGRPVTPPG